MQQVSSKCFLHEMQFPDRLDKWGKIKAQPETTFARHVRKLSLFKQRVSHFLQQSIKPQKFLLQKEGKMEVSFYDLSRKFFPLRFPPRFARAP